MESSHQDDVLLLLFARMLGSSHVLANSTTYASILNMSGILGIVRPGRQVHGCASKGGVVTDLIKQQVFSLTSTENVTSRKMTTKL